MVAAIEDAIIRVRRCGKACGILTLDLDFARRCRALGCTFTAIGVDLVMLACGTERLLATFINDDDVVSGRQTSY